MSKNLSVKYYEEKKNFAFYKGKYKKLFCLCSESSLSKKFL